VIYEEIGGYLTAQGVGSTSATSTGWRIAYRQSYPEPDQMLTIQEIGSEVSRGPGLWSPSFRVMVRGSIDAGSALETKAHEVIAALDEYSGALNGRAYQSIEMLSGPTFFGRDAQDRPEIIATFATVQCRTT
jgi:hypothetical protein